jgi:tetratricopeptide (TPR) repeat protein
MLAHGRLATTLCLAGDLDAAIASYRQALTLDPDDAPLWNAYRNLALCQQVVADDPEMARIAALAARTDLPIETRAAAGFAIAKALDDADRYDEAFAAYDQANHIYRAARAAAGDRFDAAELAQEIDRSIAHFTPAYSAAVEG